MSSKYYWIKLSMDFFDDDRIDWLSEQENGYTYIGLYLKLCLKSANRNGRLLRDLGEVIVPYTVESISKLTNIDVDTVRVGIELFKKLRLLYIDEDGAMVIPEFALMVGSSSASKDAIRMQKKRAKKQLEQSCDTHTDSTGTSNEQKTNKMFGENRTKCHTDIDIEKEIEIDKEIEIELELEKDREIDRESEKECEKKPSNRKRFTPPSIEDVQAYADEKGYSEFDAERFWCYYDSKGWMVGKNKMSNWKSAMTGWHKREEEKKPKKDAWGLSDLPF